MHSTPFGVKAKGCKKLATFHNHAESQVAPTRLGIHFMHEIAHTRVIIDGIAIKKGKNTEKQGANLIDYADN